MDIIRPTLVLDKQICLRNIELMQQKAKRHNLRLRPHFKSHQSAEIGSWFRSLGIQHIAVSSVSMAQYFAQNGWNDITITFPFNTLETEQLNNIADNIQVNIVADNEHTLKLLNSKLNKNTGIYIKITTGYTKVGISNFSIAKIEKVLKQIHENKYLQFKGFISHADHSYDAHSKNEVQTIHFDAVQKLNNLRDHFIKKYPNIELSIGDTPGCSVSENFHGIDEIRPGRFIFYDLIQHSLGVCSLDDIALRMHCPVVAKQRVRNEVIVYAGAIHFSMSSLQNTDGKPLYGRVIITQNNENKLLSSNYYLTNLSQEHGMIKVSPALFNQINIGDIIEIIPVHCGLTAQAMGKYFTKKGESIDMMH